MRAQGKERHCLNLTESAKKIWNDKFNDIEYAMRGGEYLEHYKDFLVQSLWSRLRESRRHFMCLKIETTETHL